MSAKHSYDPCRSSLWTASPQPYSGGTLSQSEVSLLTDRKKRLIGRHLPPPAHSSQLTILGSRDNTSGGSRLCLSAGGSWCCLRLGKKKEEK